MKTEKSKFRIKKIDPPEFRPYYICEERHWLWGWNSMFIVGGMFGRRDQTFESEDDAKYAIQLELEKRKGDSVEIVWEGRLNE
jgi:hypothetical protein